MKSILFIAVFSFVVFFCGCNDKTEFESFVVGERYAYELTNVKKIVVVSSIHSGAKFETTDMEQIEKITEALQPVNCTLSERQEPAGGWSYYIDFFESVDDDGWFRFSLSASPISYFYKDIDENKNDMRNFDISGDEDLRELLDSYF